MNSVRMTYIQRALGIGGLSMLDWVYRYDPVTAPI